MPQPNHNEYYLKQKDKLLKGHRKMMAIGKPLMTARYGAETAVSIIAGSTTEFEQLIPQIPYIGGKENSLTDTMIQISSLLALYRVLKRHGRSVAEIGELTYEMAQAWVDRYPKFVRHLIGRFYMSGFNRRRQQEKALISQEHEHPENFVTEFVAGDGDSFDWGINYLECGIVKFFARQGAEDLTPYMCQIDYLLFPAMGIGLQRTGTIGQGCTHCDFRFKTGGQTPPAWPPPFWIEKEVDDDDSDIPGT
jgi:hypothetical protein